MPKRIVWAHGWVHLQQEAGPENWWDPFWLEQSLIMILQMQSQFDLVFTWEAIYW